MSNNVIELLKNSGLILASALFLASCAEPKLVKICEEDGKERPCTKQEAAMIDDMHAIIASVRNYENDPETRWQIIGSKKYGDPKVFMFGEEHTDIIGLIQTLGEINDMLRKNDIILFEGGDRNSALIKECGLDRIYDIFLAWQFEKLGRSYDDMFSWKKKAYYRQLFETTKKSYDLTGLSIADAKCGYWDDGDAVRQSVADRSKISQYLERRNSSMVTAMKDRLKTHDRVIVNTGYAHMPLGDFYLSVRRNHSYYKSSPIRKVSHYYALVGAEKQKPAASRKIVLEDDTGTTKVIHDFFKVEKISHIEMIHNKFLSNR